MADTPVQRNQTAVPPSGRRPWSAPRLLEYGHIGKLTQGASGTKVENVSFKRVV